jgi:hypothetical protein
MRKQTAGWRRRERKREGNLQEEESHPRKEETPECVVATCPFSIYK